MNHTQTESTEVAAIEQRPIVAQSALAPSSPMGMMMAAMAQGASLEQVEKMMDLQDRYERRESEKVYNAAFAAFKAEAVRIMKARNEPGELPRIAAVLAELRGETPEALARQTCRNARQALPRLKFA